MFSNGADAMDWIHINCERCAKYDKASVQNTRCAFSNKVALGLFGAAPSKEEGAAYNCTGDPSTQCSQLVLASDR